MHGLVIDQPWGGLIANRKKTWEMQTRPTTVRGWIGLVGKSAGTVIGMPCLTGSPPALSQQAHHLPFNKHRVPLGHRGKFLTPWALARSFTLPGPVPYQHPSGAVPWVKFAREISRALTHQLHATYPDEEGT
jgi:hypothetical protein